MWRARKRIFENVRRPLSRYLGFLFFWSLPYLPFMVMAQNYNGGRRRERMREIFQHRESSLPTFLCVSFSLTLCLSFSTTVISSSYFSVLEQQKLKSRALIWRERGLSSVEEKTRAVSLELFSLLLLLFSLSVNNPFFLPQSL